jgi:hypothetical protein
MWTKAINTFMNLERAVNCQPSFLRGWLEKPLTLLSISPALSFTLLLLSAPRSNQHEQQNNWWIKKRNNQNSIQRINNTKRKYEKTNSKTETRKSNQFETTSRWYIKTRNANAI